MLDGLGNRRVTTETLRLPDDTLQTTVIAYEYDALYRLTDAAYTGGITATFAYEYDSVGNMTAYTETVGTETATVERQFDAANQLVVSTNPEEGTTSYYYDDNGNLVQILPPGVGGGDWAGALSYGYDQRNLLITGTTYISGTGWVAQVAYRYDGDGNRVQQTDYTGAAPLTTTYTNDNAGLSRVLVASDGVTTTHYLQGLDLVGQEDGTTMRFLLPDGLGSARLEMVGSSVESATTYEPYGKLLARSGDSGTVYGYAGEQFDAASGLVYLRARYYKPELKLFLSRDPFAGYATLSISQHPYAYAHDNPVNLTDPGGRSVSLARAIGRGCFANPLLCAVGAAALYYSIDYWLQNNPLPDVAGELTNAGRQVVGVCLDFQRDLEDTVEVWKRPNPAPQPTLPPLGPDILPRIRPDDDDYDKDVLVVGDGNFDYSRNLALVHTNWEITGTSYGDGSNNPRPALNVHNLANLMLYNNVDATKLDINTVTKDNQYDAVVFNAPRAHLGWRGATGDLVDAVLDNALNVLVSGGQTRFSNQNGWPATSRLQQRVRRPEEWPPGYSLARGGPIPKWGGGDAYLYFNDPEGFGVPYQPMRNEGTPLDVDWNKTYWYIFTK